MLKRTTNEMINDIRGQLSALPQKQIADMFDKSVLRNDEGEPNFEEVVLLHKELCPHIQQWT